MSAKAYLCVVSNDTCRQVQMSETGHLKTKTRSSAIAEIARVTIRSVIAVDRLTLIVTLNMTYVNFILLIKLLISEILYPVVSANTLNCFKSRLYE